METPPPNSEKGNQTARDPGLRRDPSWSLEKSLVPLCGSRSGNMSRLSFMTLVALPEPRNQILGGLPELPQLGLYSVFLPLSLCDPAGPLGLLPGRAFSCLLALPRSQHCLKRCSVPLAPCVYVCFFVLFCFLRLVSRAGLELAGVAQTGLKLPDVLLTLPPECWDYRGTSPRPAPLLLLPICWSSKMCVSSFTACFDDRTGGWVGGAGRSLCWVAPVRAAWGLGPFPEWRLPVGARDRTAKLSLRASVRWEDGTAGTGVESGLLGQWERNGSGQQGGGAEAFLLVHRGRTWNLGAGRGWERGAYLL